MDPKDRFTTRVDNYVKYRPRYPQQVIEVLREECRLTPEWRVADVGSGTGFLTELFVRNGNLTYAVEPNQAMRWAAEELLGAFPNFVSVDGMAEATSLPDASVELVTAAQAFHWFDHEGARREFLRILKPGGWVAIVRNERRRHGTPFGEACARLTAAHAADAHHSRVDEPFLAEFFGPMGFRKYSCENHQVLDFEALKGRVLSHSSIPEPGHPSYEPMVAELARIFEEHQHDARVVLEQDTRVWYGQLGG